MNTHSNQPPSNSSKLRNSVSFRLAIILSLSLLMLIPTIFIRNLIRERQLRRDETIREVTSLWGGEQQVFGPVLVVPYENPTKDKYGNVRRNRDYMHILPDKLSVNGEIDPESKHRGIYEVIIYTSELDIVAEFLPESLTDWPVKPDRIVWEESALVFGISDLSGLHDLSVMQWNENHLKPDGGTVHTSDIASGIHAMVSCDPNRVNTLHTRMVLKGSEWMGFVPAGKTTRVRLTSDWPDPSFTGTPLPAHETSPAGFTAEWSSLHIARPYPQKWVNSALQSEFESSAFGVNLFTPVDIYQKSERSVKYALLFIGLTFLVIFFMEIFSSERIHPVQYLLTGAALIVFYSLLLALSEHIRFGIAYLIASAGTIALIVSYATAMFSNRKYMFITLLVLSALYTFLYTVLQMSDFALLLGNIGLFVILAAVMFFSRKIEWYGKEA